MLLAVTAVGVARPRQACADLPLASASATVTAPDSAALVVFNRWIISFRGRLGAADAAERVALAERRVRAALQDGGSAEVRTQTVTEGVLLSIGTRPVFAITPADVDTMLGEPLQAAAGRAAGRLRGAIGAAADQRDVRRVLLAVAQALGAGIVLVVVLRGLFRFRRHAAGWLSARSARRQERVPAGVSQFLEGVRTADLAARLVDVATWALTALVMYLALYFVLTRFPYTAPWGDRLGDWLWLTVRGLGVRALGAIPGLATIGFLVLAARFGLRLLQGFFNAVESGQFALRWLHQDTVAPTRRIAVVLVWILTIVAAYPFVPGSGSGVFKGVSVMLGLMVSLGSGGAIGQAMSGFVLMYTRAFRKGEYVRIGDIEGSILELGVLSTKVQTNKREMMTLPNSVVVSTGTLNYSRLAAEGRGLILHTSVTIGYDAPWRVVHAMLLEAARRTRELAAEPAPFVLQRSLADFYVEYEINAFLAVPARRVPVLAELHAHIQDCFNENGIQILSPHFEAQPPQTVVVPPRDWHRPLVEPPPEAGIGTAQIPGATPAKPPEAP